MFWALWAVIVVLGFLWFGSTELLVKRIEGLENENSALINNLEMLKRWADQKDHHIAALTKTVRYPFRDNHDALLKASDGFLSDNANFLREFGSWEEVKRGS